MIFRCDYMNDDQLLNSFLSAMSLINKEQKENSSWEIGVLTSSQRKYDVKIDIFCKNNFNRFLLL